MEDPACPHHRLRGGGGGRREAGELRRDLRGHGDSRRPGSRGALGRRRADRSGLRRPSRRRR
eukprot:5639400-Alexandrium_andersonii.AAC.1